MQSDLMGKNGTPWITFPAPGPFLLPLEDNLLVMVVPCISTRIGHIERATLTSSPPLQVVTGTRFGFPTSHVKLPLALPETLPTDPTISQAAYSLHIFSLQVRSPVLGSLFPPGKSGLKAIDPTPGMSKPRYLLKHRNYSCVCLLHQVL